MTLRWRKNNDLYLRGYLSPKIHSDTPYHGCAPVHALQGVVDPGLSKKPKCFVIFKLSFTHTIPMRRPRSRLEGQEVEIMATGMEYAIHGRINRIVEEVKSKDFTKWCYELETSDGHIYLIDLDEVCWASTKKRKFNHLKIVDIHAARK